MQLKKIKAKQITSIPLKKIKKIIIIKIEIEIEIKML